MAISIQFRKDSAENWETNNPILLEGELGAIIVDNDNGISSITEFKIGNGVNHWNDLPLVSTNSKFSDNDITEILQNIQDINNSINNIEEDISVIVDISSNVETNSNNISDINLRLLDIATDISSANTNISAVYENIVNTTDSFYTRLNDMETAVCSTIISAASKASVNAISENISILTLSADTINKNVDNINSTITDNLYEVSTTLKNSINSLEDDYETVSDDIDNINVKISNISSEISSKAEIAHTHEISSINNLESRILALNSDISTNRDNIEEVSTYIKNNVLTDTSIIPANNISINDTSLDTVINSKLDVENDTIHVDKIVLGNTFITANEINDGISSYNFNNLATKDDLTTLSANVAAASTKLSGITITPADITSDNAQWVIYKDGTEESVNKIIISQDYYDSAYHPTRLPSRYEVDNTISSNIENHNISIDAHQNIIEPISTLIFEHRTESETKLETLSADISTIHTNIADLQDH
jgi:predicted  nucleic acid-binding Zn-ribbon protein